jgi:hypothetical protein
MALSSIPSLQDKVNRRARCPCLARDCAQDELMAKRRRNRRTKVQGTPSPPKFCVGDHVRVRAGVSDPDFPGVTLEGWSGTVCDVETGLGFATLVLVEWDRLTLEHMDQAYRSECEQDDLDVLHIWLYQDELEPAGNYLTPLNLPGIEPGEAKRFHWSVNFADKQGLRPLRLSSLGVVRFGIYSGFCGAILGAVLRAVDGAIQAVAVGATILGLLGWLAGARFGWFLGTVNRVRFGPFIGGLCGSIAGGLLGAFGGAAAFTIIAGYVGALIGMVVGAILGSYRAGAGAGCIRPLLGAIGGALLGPCVETIYRNPDAALVGAAYGAGVGAAAGTMLYLALVGIVASLSRNGSSTRRVSGNE